ncbi:MAG TPA: hypothetical protein VIF62_31330 [Labilithrix sp.]|jgi:hypothetical protein
MRRRWSRLGVGIACLGLVVLAGCGSLLGIDGSDDNPPPAPPAPVDGSGPETSVPPPGPVDASDAASSDAADETDAIDVFDCSSCNTGHCNTPGKCDPLIFVTSVASASDGALGGVGVTGVARADARCNAVATAALLKNTFRAWISDESTDAKAHVPDTGRPLRRKDEQVVAPNIAWLSTTNALYLPVSLDELGADVGAAHVWTGTNQIGTRNTGSTCTSWTSNAGNANGQYGVANATNFAWVASTSQVCDGTVKASIYCIEIAVP